jgi:hypothetical protein
MTSVRTMFDLHAPTVIGIERRLSDLWGENFHYWGFGGIRWAELPAWHHPTPDSRFEEPDTSSISPLEHVKIHWNEGTAEYPSHCHYVTYGLTDLYFDPGPVTREEFPVETTPSGFGIELTMRITHAGGDEDIYFWPASELRDHAKYIHNTKRVFRPGHFLDREAPILNGVPTKLEGYAFWHDPQLDKIVGKGGYMDFVTAVGLTRDELELCSKFKSSYPVLAGLMKENPFLITDWTRDSILRDEAMVQFIHEESQKLVGDK